MATTEYIPYEIRHEWGTYWLSYRLDAHRGMTANGGSTEESRDAAIAARVMGPVCAAELVASYTAGLPQEISREDFERECDAHGWTAYPDYALGEAAQGSFAFPEYTASEIMRVELCRVRRDTVRAEQLAVRAPVETASLATCPGCGVMDNPRGWSTAAGYGPACPDCYDRLAEQGK
jgi:hypothetical protein